MGEIKQFYAILEGQMINTVYQPIVSLKDGRIYGYEALSRISLKDCDIMIEDLFSLAKQHNKIWQLEKICRSKALKNAVKKPEKTKIFINVDANIINDPEFGSGFTLEKLNEYNLNSNDIVFEITEESAIDNTDSFVKSIKHYQSQKYKIAIDDFGSGYSGLNRVCMMQPDFLKLDMQLIKGIDSDIMKKSAVSATVQFCKENGIHVIAEGIETEKELQTVIRLGVEYGQGYFLAKPQPGFCNLELTVEKCIMQINERYNRINTSSCFDKIETIRHTGYRVHKDAPSLPLYESMSKNSHMTEAFVLDERDEVCGIITRSSLLGKYSGEYGYNLSRRMPVNKLMQDDCMVADKNLSIDEVASLAMKRDINQVYDAIAITDKGKYTGCVFVKDLLVSAINIQVKRAAESNPLTGLPGNSEIQMMIRNVIANNETFAIIYLDLDNFKAYNDAYGFGNGDMMIKAVSDALKKCCCDSDFIGHVGGDDFVVVSYQNNIEPLCDNIINTFNASIKDLYSEEDWNRGYIISKGRDNTVKRFPIATLSIAAVTNRNIKNITQSDISYIVADTKKRSKQQDGNSLVVI